MSPVAEQSRALVEHGKIGAVHGGKGGRQGADARSLHPPPSRGAPLA